MRIGWLNATETWGGGERWFCDAARALAARGHDGFVAGHPGGALLERLQADTALEAIDIGDVSRALETAPDVLVCNSRREVRDASRALGKRRDIAVVLRRGIDRPLHDHLLRRRTWKRLSAILVNSDATGRTVRASLPWFPDERIHRIYNPVTLDARERTTGEPGVLRIGAIARLVRQKGLDVLIDALGRLRDAAHAPSVAIRATIAGDGKLRAALEARANRLGLGDACRFVGHVDDLAGFYSQHDVIAIPSRYEGFCFVAAEAALAGLPVVASHVSSLIELVEDGVTGRLVAPDDPGALADALADLATDPQRARAMGDAARDRACERFAPEPLHDELEAWLDRVRALGPVG